MSMTVAQAFDRLFPGAPVRFEVYDGSVGGRSDAQVGLRLENERGLRYVLTAPGSLGMARAYIAGDITVTGVPLGDPYGLLRMIDDDFEMHRPSVREAAGIARSVGLAKLVPPPPPPQETPAPWRRAMHGLRHNKNRDSEAIHYHYDVSNRFYEMVLGPSMAYTCACYPSADSTLEQAQANKFDLVAQKLDLRPGQRLLDVGCGWGGMVRHAVRNYGVRAIGVTLSREQATWAGKAIAEEGLDGAEVRHLDYRDVPEGDFDAVSSIGLTEHIGVKNYPAYFSLLRDKLRPGGRLLNHSITRPDNLHPGLPGRGFINRYVFPDGELTGAGTIISVMQDHGLEVRHAENLREHYAMTLLGWCANLQDNWEECVAEAGLPTSKVWGLYMAGSRLAFERNEIQLHQVLAVKPDEHGNASFPLRPTWTA